MRVSTLLLFVSLFSVNAASASTPEDVLHHLRSALGIVDVNSHNMECKDGLIGKAVLSFGFNSSRRLFIASIQTSAVGKYLWRNTLLFAGAAGGKISDDVQFIDVEIRESSPERLVIKSKLAVGSQVVTQTLDYEKSSRYIVIQDGSWLPGGTAVCHLK